MFMNIAWEDREMFCEATEEDELGDSSNGAEDGRVRPGNKDVRTLWGSGRAKGRLCRDTLKRGTRQL